MPNKGEGVRYPARIIILSDLNCRGYCLFVSYDNSIPMGFRGGKTWGFDENSLTVTSNVLLSNLLVKDMKLLLHT